MVSKKVMENINTKMGVYSVAIKITTTCTVGVSITAKTKNRNTKVC